MINHAGEVSVVGTGDRFEVLHTTPMGDKTTARFVRASIAIAHGHLFVRTTRQLYAIGSKD